MRAARAAALLPALLLQRSAASSPFVRVEQDAGGAWWFVRGGERFLSAGVNHVNYGGLDDGVGGRERAQCVNRTGNAQCGDTLSFAADGSGAPYYAATMRKYGSAEAWAGAAASRLEGWGFNTVGGWSATVAEGAATRRGMLYTRLLDIGTTWLNHGGLDHDVWSDAFEEQADAVARRECLPRANDTALLGWQLDNELQWGSEQLSLAAYLRLPNGSAGGDRARAFVAAHGRDDAAFLGAVAERYFSVTAAAVRRYDPNHLNLGLRGMNLAAEAVALLPFFGFRHLKAVVEAQVKYVDVVDWHAYLDTPDGDYCGAPVGAAGVLEELYAAAGKPVLVGEFSFTAKDSGMPNKKGARACFKQFPVCLPGCPYATQAQRAGAYTRYVSALAALPFVVGWHWWQWVDEPQQGRWPDGENSNYGVVDIGDDAYPAVVAEMNRTNRAAAALHAAAPAP